MGQLIPPGLQRRSQSARSAVNVPGPKSEKIFDDRIAQLLNERRFCYVIADTAFVEGKGFRVSIAIEHEPGHFPTGNTPEGGDIEPWYWGDTFEEAREMADKVNKSKLGLEPVDAFKIIATTLGASPRITPSQKRLAARAKQPTKKTRAKR